ncbi:TonB-dependent receptor plug domain-containing protein [Flavobacterium silvaticum]|uniref:TonB-dependent receptor n=1 Tax=Flavobacterium silvaticum TaxID=1852020 RepID=A0A972JFM8_9FLAO|nr:TonB-dependent receptor [Flavobacterium silvaticum]NMH28139.1 TonB-dependent receptor [Flavobacterium silvaticum]
MYSEKWILPALLLLCLVGRAQQDTVFLRQVDISDVSLKRYGSTQKAISISDSVYTSNRTSLGGLIQFNSPVYIRENGIGGVSSASFRGTTAQQTAVIWNGININSQFNGQFDFNSYYTSDAGQITVRPGGGSVLFGSSAIGGSIHLNTTLDFYRHLDNRVSLSYGSFDTGRFAYNINASDGKFSVNASVSHNRSENDYPFPDSDRNNLNGAFFNTGISAAAGYRINHKNIIRLYSQYSSGERHFSLISPSETPTKYQDRNSRNLLEWIYGNENFNSRARVAYLEEQYRYFETLNDENPSFGLAKTVIGKYDAALKIRSNMFVNALVEYASIRGSGTDVRQTNRNIGSGTLVFRHIPGKFLYELGIRQELSDDYSSPVLFSAGGKYQITSNYSLRFNGSRNYRIPSFNDLYWADGGNPDLKPESSYQAEIGQDFQWKNLSAGLTVFYMDISDMIQWLPGTTAAWRPVNVNEVESFGLEFSGKHSFESGSHKLVSAVLYSYTNSQNAETEKQLIYVPKHKATAALDYTYDRFGVGLQGLFTGSVPTRSDNNPRYDLDGYFVGNGLVSYRFGKQKSIVVEAQVRNVFDQEYQTMINRPYPGRHYTFSLTLML